MTSLVDNYLDLILSKAKHNKYTQWYSNLIESRRTRSYSNLEQDFELHHIAPVSLFPEYKNSELNIIPLTPREHYVAHLLLSKMFEGKDADKMIRAIFLMMPRMKYVSSHLYEKMRKQWAQRMRLDNPMKDKEISSKIAIALIGRTKETHEYIRLAAEKKSQYTEENSEWLRNSRIKFRKMVSNMSSDERAKMFGHEWSIEVRKKLSKERTGKTKNNCKRVLKMAKTKALRASLMTEDEKRKAFSTTTGYKWFHSDEKRKSILVPRDSKLDPEWISGRKFYENKED